MALATYKRKRDFRRTPEPAAKEAKRDPYGPYGLHRFVVQEHHATRLHFDFRLEMGGVLKSWAVPKGPSLNPADKRLAVMTEDHPVEYANFEGHIPEGEYGGGDVAIWDRGKYEAQTDEDLEKKIAEGKLRFRLYGDKLQGDFTLVRMGGKNWLLTKVKDRYADPDWELEQIIPGIGHQEGRRRTLCRSYAGTRGPLWAGAFPTNSARLPG